MSSPQPSPPMFSFALTLKINGARVLTAKLSGIQVGVAIFVLKQFGFL